MLVQIYSLTTPEDVRFCVDCGVDHIGFAPGDQGLPASISNEFARELFDIVPPDRQTVALSVHETVEDIVALANDTNPDIIHICSDTQIIGPTKLEMVRNQIPDEMDLMKAINVADESAVDAAREVDDIVDWLLLDTATASVAGVGASGKTHDWSVSRRVVETTVTPVILAGGLSPENVAKAIQTVEPTGVDSYSHTSRSEHRKDSTLVRQFVENARAAVES